MMAVEINQWRATIGCFRASVQRNFSLSNHVTPFSLLFQILRVYWFSICFLAVSIVFLPLALLIQFLAVHSLATQLCFLPLFASVHHFATIVIYTTSELSKRIPLGIISLVRHKHMAVKQYLSLSIYFCIGCITCDTLHIQWLVFRTILFKV